MKVIDGIKSHFVPFTEDEEKKTLFINNKTITVYRSDLPNPSSCPDLSNEPISSSSLVDVNLSQGSQNLLNQADRPLLLTERHWRSDHPCFSQKDISFVYEQTKDWKKNEVYEVTKCKAINADQVSHKKWVI